MDNTMKIAKTIFMALLFGLILSGCNKNELSPLETPDFGFGGENTEGAIIIEPVDKITINLPAEYQTVTVELKPINPLYSNTPETKAAEAALVNGEWSFDVQYAEDNKSAIINVKAEYPTFTEALLSVTIIDIKGLEYKISKVLKRDISADYEFDEATKTYTVKSLIGLRMVNKLLYTYINDESYDNDDMNVLLACDVNFHENEEDMNYNWIPIMDRTNSSEYLHHYQGTFDGAGHSIEGISLSYEYDYVGMFGRLGKNAVVKNLILKYIRVNGMNNVGAIAGRNDGTIMDCEVNAYDDVYSGNVTGEDNVGGLVGYNKGEIIRCKRLGNGIVCMISARGYNVGGIAGDNRNLIDQCIVEGANLISGYGDSAGGIAGSSNGVISNCSVKGVRSGITVVTGYGSGGIVGYMNRGKIINCSVSKIRVKCNNDSGSSYIDGAGTIVGFAGSYESIDIVGCYASGVTVYSFGDKGGIVGVLDEVGSVIACFSYQTKFGTPDDMLADLPIVEGEAGIFGASTGSILQSYYQGAEGSPLFGVDTGNAELADNWIDAVQKMNEAIDKYNETAEVKCEGKWSGSMRNPVFVTETTK